MNVDHAKRFSEALGIPSAVAYCTAKPGRDLCSPGLSIYGRTAAFRLRMYLAEISGPSESACIDQGKRFADAFEHVRHARKQKARHLCGRTCTAVHALEERLGGGMYVA